MKIIMFTAVTLSALATAALADDRPLWDQQAGSPMDFIVHSQPAKYPHHLGTPAQGASVWVINSFRSNCVHHQWPRRHGWIALLE